MVGCTKSTKNINKYANCYGGSLFAARKLMIGIFHVLAASRMNLLSCPFIFHHLSLSDDSGGSGDGGDGGGDGSSDEASGEGSSGVGSDHGGVVDHVVGGVGRGLGVNVDAGNVVDGVADLVADKTGLGDQVGLDGLVDGGGGDSDRDGGVDGLHVDSGDSVDSSDGSGVDGGDRGSSDSRGSDSGSGSNGS